MVQKKKTCKKKHYAYIVECKHGTYYAGYTNDIKERIKVHNEGKGAKYLKGKGPVKLVWVKEFKDQNSALKAEYEIKQLRRKGKEALVGLVP